MLPVAFTDPNLAFALVILGALGIYWELHAPGMIFPGLLGLMLVAAGILGLYEDQPTWYGFVILALAVVLLAIELKYYTNMISGLAGSILLALGAIVLLQGPRRVTPALAISTSLALGLITVFLGSLAVRARRSAPLTGSQTLIGETGVSRTDLNPQGTVFVRGEYWQAVADESILAGKRVSVERVKDLLLYVKEI
jgi:membrane-bound serine protease (ClpP class)